MSPEQREEWVPCPPTRRVMLTSGELQAVLDVARVATASTDEAAFHQERLDAIRDAIPCDFANLADFEPGTGSLRASYSPPDARSIGVAGAHAPVPG